MHLETNLLFDTTHSCLVVDGQQWAQSAGMLVACSATRSWERLKETLLTGALLLAVFYLNVLSSGQLTKSRVDPGIYLV